MTQHRNYARRLLDVFAEEPHRTVLWWRGEPIAAGVVVEEITAAARNLAARADGDLVVGLLTDTNSPDTVLLRYAANLVGATVVHLQTTNAVDPTNRIPEAVQLELIERAGVTLLAVDKSSCDTARQLCARLSAPPALASLRVSADDVLDLAAGDGSPADLDGLTAAVDPDRIAVVTQTSGTTGAPKGIAVTFRSRSEIVETAATGPAGVVYLSALPMSHSSGGMADGILASRGAVVLHETFDAGEVLRTIQERRVNQLFVSPPQLYRLQDHPARPGTDLSSLRMLVYAGCPVAPARLDAAVGTFGPVLVQVYGTGEAGMITMLSPIDHLDPALRRTVGAPVGEVRIRDEDDERDLPVGEIGQVCARTPFTMQGYWRNPQRTAEVLRDGWLYTGDLGWLDERGYLHLEGRMAEVVKTRGIKVYPAAVENVLLAHPDVAQAAVFGVADADRVEHLHAAVVARPGTAVTAEQLRAHVTAELSAEHAPVAIELRATLPLTGHGKPDKRVLRAGAA